MVPALLAVVFKAEYDYSIPVRYINGCKKARNKQIFSNVFSCSGDFVKRFCQPSRNVFENKMTSFQ